MRLAELHPFVVHFAVALLLTGPVCDALGLLLHREGLVQTGRWTSLLGSGAAATSVLSGLAAEASLGTSVGPGAPLLSLHRALGLLTLFVWVAVAIWRAASKLAIPRRLRTLYLTFAFAGAVLILGQTGLGSVLVYRHGLGLAPSARAVPPSR